MVYCIGLAIFYVGWFTNLVFNCFLKKSSFARTGAAYWMWALLETFGLIITTTADLDANLYFKRNRFRGVMLAFTSLLLSFGTGLYNVDAGKIAGAVWMLQAVPILYLGLRFENVVEMRRGYPRFTELLVYTFIIDICCAATNSIATPMGLAGAECGNGPCQGYWEFYLIGTLSLFGALCIFLVHKRDWNLTLTMRANLAIYSYLGILGVQQFLFALVYRNYMSVSTGQWAFGPIHVIP
jgi:hypothetical protein